MTLSPFFTAFLILRLPLVSIIYQFKYKFKLSIITKKESDGHQCVWLDSWNPDSSPHDQVLHHTFRKGFKMRSLDTDTDSSTNDEVLHRRSFVQKEFWILAANFPYLKIKFEISIIKVLSYMI